MTTQYPNSATAEDFISLKAEYIDNGLALDPVHRPGAYLGPIQPADHCEPAYFPPVAESFGLLRHIPSPTDNVAYHRSRGPKCVLPNGRAAACHKSEVCAPSFCYT